jgi:ATP:corrinoid adenosyltransferase
MFLLDELLAALKEFENNAEEVAQLLQNKESKVHVLYLQIVPGVR